MRDSSMTFRLAIIEKDADELRPMGLTPLQQVQLDGLAASVDRDQAGWLSGYFASLAEMRGHGIAGAVRSVSFPGNISPAPTIPVAANEGWKTLKPYLRVVKLAD
jgi:hypothetical protein